MKESIAVEPGRLAVSCAGRDKGRCFIITKVDNPYVYVVDGALRKLDKPKKKKLMHLSVKPLRADDISEKLLSGDHLLDSDVRKAIEAFGFCVKDNEH